ncbi:MAG: Gfo/Idh/MocA family oxidoreductase, partial [Acidimicrobiales bacterium]
MTKRAALDIALCGAGAAAALHALAAQHLPGAIVRVVAAPRRDRAEAFARQIGARAVGLDDLPAACRLVIVAAPPSAHEAAAGAAVRGGASVLV